MHWLVSGLLDWFWPVCTLLFWLAFAIPPIRRSVIKALKRMFPDLLEGLRRGLVSFIEATRELIDGMPFDAGRSLGGIYGKRAAQAITPKNHVAELYKPAVLGPEKTNLIAIISLWLRRCWFFCAKLLRFRK
jgi:hypothetical protein